MLTSMGTRVMLVSLRRERQSLEDSAVDEKFPKAAR